LKACGRSQRLFLQHDGWAARNCLGKDPTILSCVGICCPAISNAEAGICLHLMLYYAAKRADCLARDSFASWLDALKFSFLIP
jgi:hypothetical protein